MRVFLTGASSGLGAALARHYAARGAVLGLVARNEDRLKRLAAGLPGGGHRYYVCDVADAVAMQAAGREFINAEGLPDLVIANAGVSVGTEGGEAEDLRVLERVLRTNVLGVAASLQPFVEPMRRRGSGRLAAIGSVAGVRGLPGSGAYSASKAAVRCWMESLRVELHGSGVRAVLICPGYIDTPMTRVNPYRMPFLLSSDVAAERIARAIARGARVAVVPWQMGLVAAALQLLPGAIYDRLFARAQRKPRGLPL